MITKGVEGERKASKGSLTNTRRSELDVILALPGKAASLLPVTNRVGGVALSGDFREQSW